MRKMKKLNLSRETLRTLSQVAVVQVAGGYSYSDFCGSTATPLRTLGCTGNPANTQAPACHNIPE